MEALQTLARFLSTLLSLYTFAIVIRIFLSWGGIGASRFGRFYDFVTKITDPYLTVFRRIPGLQRGMLDFSPIAAMIVIGILNNLLIMFAEQGRISLGIVLALIVQAAGSVLSFFIILFIILYALRLYMEYRRSPNSIQYIAILDNLLAGTTSRIHRLLLRGREVPSRTLFIYSLASFIVLQIVFRAVVRWLGTYLAGLPF